MKKDTGFTLLEVVVVVVLIATLSAVAALYFGRMSQKYKIESTTKEIYSLLMKARNDAAKTNIRHIAVLAANQIQCGRDDDGDGTIDGAASVIQLPSFLINFGVSPIVFDRRGITTDVQTIRVTGYPATVTPVIDCIQVDNTRVNMGRWQGGICVQQ